MLRDHRALIDQARAEHQPFELDGKTYCYGCTVDLDDGRLEADSGPYPCLTARLADALADTEGAVRREESLVRRCGLLRSYAVKFRDMLAIADRRVAELEAERDQQTTLLADLAVRCVQAERRAANLERVGDEWKVLYYGGQIERAKLEEEAANLARDLAAARAELQEVRAWTREHADHLLRCKAIGGRWDRSGTWQPPTGPCTCGRDAPAPGVGGGEGEPC